MNGILIIMAKQPVNGAVKTRLCPPLTESEAMQLYLASLTDTIALVDKACELAPGITPALAYAPLSAHSYFHDLVPSHFVLLPQQGADLGERLRNLPEQARALGYSAAGMISSDSPTLDPDVAARAFTELVQPDIDVSLGPCTDGGYYLIAVKSPQPALFTGITWSTGSVTAETLAAAEMSGLRVSLLPEWPDIDTADDLFALQTELAANPSAAPHTRAALNPILERLVVSSAGT